MNKHQLKERLVLLQDEVQQLIDALHEDTRIWWQHQHIGLINAIVEKGPIEINDTIVCDTSNYANGVRKCKPTEQPDGICLGLRDTKGPYNMGDAIVVKVIRWN